MQQKSSSQIKQIDVYWDGMMGKLYFIQIYLKLIRKIIKI